MIIAIEIADPEDYNGVAHRSQWGVEAGTIRRLAVSLYCSL